MKNAWEIQKAKEVAKLQKRTKQLIPEIYACFAKALYDSYGWNADQIEELFIKTQNLWGENVDMMDNMIKWVEDTTDIALRGPDYVGGDE